ncbi:MAG: tetratricopeptide repeat protein [Sphingobacteriaceae bacterium]|nr:tetratricopeptide repeat protein [Sphingobacteriaceae bacterium]
MINIKSQNPDSLKRILLSLSSIEKINAYVKIGTIYSDNYGQPDSLLLYSTKANDLAKSTTNQAGILKSMLNIAVAYQKKNALDTSIVILERMISDNPNLSDDNLNCDIKFNLGLNYRLSDNNKLAITNFLTAIQHYESAKNISGLATCFVKLAGTFTIEKQTKQSLFYARKANSLLSDKVEPNKRIGILSTLSGVYINASIDDKTLIDSSIYFAQEALKLVDEYKYYTKGNQLCVSICNAHTLKGDYKKALEYCKKSMNYKSYLFPSEIIVSYLNFGDCYINLKDYKLGLTYLDSSLAIARN